MIRTCCPECRLRCSPAAAIYLEACPECGNALAEVTSPRELVGFRLLDLEASPPVGTDSFATAVALPLPDPAGRRM